jgi:CRP-like cAMP-binding protein
MPISPTSLNGFDEIQRLSMEAKEALAKISRIKQYKRHEIVQQPGSLCRTVYWVIQGIARIYYFKDGNEITEHFSAAGDVIVRAESLFTAQPASKGIQTVTDADILAIDAPALFCLYDTHHDLERLFRLIFEREYVNTVKRIESLQFKSARERYLELTENTDIIRRVPLKYIASYLGITQVTLSRIRSGLSSGLGD